MRRADVSRLRIGEHPMGFGTPTFPLTATQFRILVPSINRVCRQLSDESTKKYIRRKMLPRPDTRIADHTRSSIRQKLGQDAGILMRDYARHRPRNGRMLGRKGSAILKKASGTIALKWPVTSEGILGCFGDDHAVQRSLAREKSGLSRVGIMILVAESPHQTRTAG